MSAPQQHQALCYLTTDIRDNFCLVLQSVEGNFNLSASHATPDQELARRALYGGASNVADIRVGVYIFSGGRALCAPVFSGFVRCHSSGAAAFGDAASRTVTFPLTFADLPRDTLVVFAVFEASFLMSEAAAEAETASTTGSEDDEVLSAAAARHIGAGSLRLFDRQGICLSGTEHVLIHSGLSVHAAAGRLGRCQGLSAVQQEVYRLRILKHRLGALGRATAPVDGCAATLAALVSRRLEALNQLTDEAAVGLQVRLGVMPGGPIAHESILHATPPAPARRLILPPTSSVLLLTDPAAHPAAAGAVDSTRAAYLTDASEAFLAQVRRTVAELRTDERAARTLRPSGQELADLRALCRYWAFLAAPPGLPPSDAGAERSPYQLPLEMRELVWRFRYWLSAQQGGLVPFVSVAAFGLTADVAADSRAAEAEALMSSWSAPVSTAELLALLAPEFAPPLAPRFIREAAASRLSAQPTEEVAPLLDFCVQHARWEAVSSCSCGQGEQCAACSSVAIGAVGRMLISHAVHGSVALCCRLHWLLSSELEVCKRSLAVANDPLLAANQTHGDTMVFRTTSTVDGANGVTVSLTIEREISYYTLLKDAFTTELLTRAPATSAALQAQVAWVHSARELCNDVVTRLAKNTRQQRPPIIRGWLADPATPYYTLAHPPAPVPSPVHPDVLCGEIDPDKIHIYKSAMMPLRLALLEVGDTPAQQKPVRRRQSVDSDEGLLAAPATAAPALGCAALQELAPVVESALAWPGTETLQDWCTTHEAALRPWVDPATEDTPAGIILAACRAEGAEGLGARGGEAGSVLRRVVGVLAHRIALRLMRALEHDEAVGHAYIALFTGWAAATGLELAPLPMLSSAASLRRWLREGVLCHVMADGTVCADDRAAVEQVEQFSSVFILKNGDDVRQDQFILQVWRITSHQISRVLDLRLRTYCAIAFSPDFGAVEIVNPAVTVQDCIQKYKTINAYLCEHNPNPDGTIPTQPPEAVMENYIRSSAGYAVLTYLFGIGDRHLENLMLQPDGHFFHIDFGFILGRDPKPFPPVVKLSNDLVNAMGDRVQKFQALAVEAFNHCRRHAPLIVTCTRAMRYSRIAALEADGASDFARLAERFCLTLSDAQAASHFTQLLDRACKAVIPQFMDRMHVIAQALRD